MIYHLDCFYNGKDEESYSVLVLVELSADVISTSPIRLETVKIGDVKESVVRTEFSLVASLSLDVLFTSHGDFLWRAGTSNFRAMFRYSIRGRVTAERLNNAMVTRDVTIEWGDIGKLFDEGGFWPPHYREDTLQGVRDLFDEIQGQIIHDLQGRLIDLLTYRFYQQVERLTPKMRKQLNFNTPKWVEEYQTAAWKERVWNSNPVLFTSVYETDITIPEIGRGVVALVEAMDASPIGAALTFSGWYQSEQI